MLMFSISVPAAIRPYERQDRRFDMVRQFRPARHDQGKISVSRGLLRGPISHGKRPTERPTAHR
jgi:hypothetical protein